MVLYDEHADQPLATGFPVGDQGVSVRWLMHLP